MIKELEMKNIKYIILVSLLGSFFAFSSCNKENVSKNTTIGLPMDYTVYKKGNFKSLAEIYHNHGNFINTDQFPPIISAVDVFQNSKDWLLVDIRSKEAYEAGHISGAYNIKREVVFDFLIGQQKASAYEKVVIVGYSGQMASYVTGVLRYAGFDNTFVMLFGMAAWNPANAEVLKNGYAKKYAEMVEQSESSDTIHKEAHTSDEALEFTEDVEQRLPKLTETYPSVLISDRAKALLQKPTTTFLLEVDGFMPDVKEDINKYYTLSYLNKKNFDEGHIKGAKLFNTRKDLGLDHKLTELPTDKPIIVYGKTGHTSGNATAYLDMLGYDAHNLNFGLNSFNYDASSNALDDILNEFPVVKGKKRIAKIVN